MSINFPDFPHNMGFVLLHFPVMGKSMLFPYDDIGCFFPVISVLQMNIFSRKQRKFVLILSVFKVCKI